MGGAPRNPAPRNHLTIRLSLHGWALDKQSFHSGSNKYRRVQTHLRSTSPFSDCSPRRTARSRRRSGEAGSLPGFAWLGLAGLAGSVALTGLAWLGLAWLGLPWLGLTGLAGLAHLAGLVGLGIIILFHSLVYYSCIS